MEEGKICLCVFPLSSLEVKIQILLPYLWKYFFLRVIRTAKEELFWLKEWQSIKQVEDALNRWVKNYNTSYLHSSLGYKTPVSIEANYKEKEVA